MRKQLDQVFEVICTGMEMIDAVVEAHGSLKTPQGKDDPKSDHPASFAQSLLESEGQDKKKHER